MPDARHELREAADSRAVVAELRVLTSGEFEFGYSGGLDSLSPARVVVLRRIPPRLAPIMCSADSTRVCAAPIPLDTRGATSWMSEPHEPSRDTAESPDHCGWQLSQRRESR